MIGQHPTISDAAAELGVSWITLQRWIETGRVPEPPHIYLGKRRVRIFPPEYMKKLAASLEAEAVSRSSKRRRSAERDSPQTVPHGSQEAILTDSAKVVALAAGAAGTAAAIRNVIGTVKETLDIKKHLREAEERRKEAEEK